MTSPIAVRNPRTGEHDYEISPPSADELAAQVADLRSAQAAWAAAGLNHRIDVLQRFKNAVLKNKDVIADALMVDTGRRLIAHGETLGTAGAIDKWCALAPELLAEPEEQTSRQHPSIQMQTQLVPYELVGVISPWNFPLTLSLIDAIPALAAGCAVLIKPSEVTPRFVAPLQDALAEVPELEKVLGFVLGGGETGAALVESVDVVCFTGSVATGRKVGEAAARAFIPAFLELGGKDPLIVMESADVDVATDAVLRSTTQATGQACQSVERIYVPQSIHDTFVEKLVEKAEAATLNWPDIKTGQIGPLIFEKQAATIAEHIADAKAKGAQVRAGGEVEEHDGGLYVRPTVITGVDHSMKVMTEETFGPVIPVMAYDSLEHAVALANESEFGLSGAVLAGSREEAEPVARAMDVGAVSINDGALTARVSEAEKNSFKLSGMGGSRMGPAGLTRFLRKKALLVQTEPPPPLASVDESNLP